MKREEVLKLITEKVKEIFIGDDEIVTESSVFYKDLDSLDVIELIISIEKELDISIPDEVFFDLETVGDLINVVLNEIKVK